MGPATPSAFASSRHSSSLKSAYSSSPDRIISSGRCYNVPLKSCNRLPGSKPNSNKACCRPAASPSDEHCTAAAEADPETLRLFTAATILSSPSASPASSRDDAAALAAAAPLFGAAGMGSSFSTDDEPDFASTDEDDGPLSLLDELHELDAQSLSLVVGILRRHQPVDVESSCVQLSERLLDFLALLQQRPIKLLIAASGDDVNPAADTPAAAVVADVMSSSRGAGSHSGGDLITEDLTDGFWAGPDEWSDVRAALMNIGIDADLANDEDDDEEDVWAMEEEGPARRTRLLKSLPKLNASTAAALATFLAEVQQRTPAASAPAAAPAAEHGSSNTWPAGQEQLQGAAAPSLLGDSEEELWWERVTEAYKLLWQQARRQQLQFSQQHSS